MISVARHGLMSVELRVSLKWVSCVRRTHAALSVCVGLHEIR